jgi:pilus assembly protein Flp/PilA
MTNFLSRFMKDESGATAIEYGLIAAIVSVGIITVLGQVSGGLNTAFGRVATGLQGAGASGGESGGGTE